MGKLYSAAFAGGVFLAACASAGSTGTETATSSAPATAPAADPGYYTAAQAERGNEVWDQSCVECHELREVRGSDFMFEWEGSSVGRLYRVISRTMPDDNPGVLPQEDYLAVVAYILQLNEFPAGEVALGSDMEALNEMRIER